MINPEKRGNVLELSKALGNLHRTLLAMQEREYRHKHLLGRPPADLLQLVVSDPDFAWLHPLSELIVGLDAIADAAQADGPEPGPAIATIVESVISPDVAITSVLRDKLHRFIQASPEVAGAYAQMRVVLQPFIRQEPSTTAEELHVRHQRAVAEEKKNHLH